jgi:hypothetical protein
VTADETGDSESLSSLEMAQAMQRHRPIPLNGLPQISSPICWCAGQIHVDFLFRLRQLEKSSRKRPQLDATSHEAHKLRVARVDASIYIAAEFFPAICRVERGCVGTVARRFVLAA